MKPSASYRVDTDIQKILAAFLVVMIHVSATCIDTTAGLVYDAIARCSVPIFVMVSGACLLERPRPAGDLARRCLRLFLLLVAWSAIYYLVGIFGLGNPFGGGAEMVGYLLTGPTHLWYLYMAIGLYLLTPLLQQFCRHASPPLFRYGLAVTFVLGSVITTLVRSEQLPLLTQIMERMKLNWPVGFLFCYLMGAYLRRYPATARWFWGIAFLLGTGATVSGVLLLPRTGPLSGELMMSFFAPNVLVAAVGLYCLVQSLCRKHSKARRWLHWLANGMLGVYLLHPLLILMLQGRGIALQGNQPWLWIPIWTALLFLVCTVGILLLQRIPGLRRLAG